MPSESEFEWEAVDDHHRHTSNTKHNNRPSVVSQSNNNHTPSAPPKSELESNKYPTSSMINSTNQLSNIQDIIDDTDGT